MSFAREDFQAALKDRAAARTAEAMPLYRAAVAVAPVMEKLLTGNEAFDRYLTYLQGFIDQATAAKGRAQEKLADPLVWAVADLHKLKSDVLVAGAMIDAWTAAMELPRALVAGGQEAAGKLARFEESNANAADNAQP